MQWKTEIDTARNRIEKHVVQTPILHSSGLGLDFPIELKLEHLQHTGSFKARGAFNTLVSTNVPAAGVVAASGGNHGAAVAYAARSLGHRASIFVPELAGPAKIALIERTGADLTVVPGEYADAMAQAKSHEASSGAMQVHAYDAVATVVGQGTVLAEWEAQGLADHTVFIAVGGGGLIAGAMAWAQGARKIIAVEPETSCALAQARHSGAPVDVAVSGVAANALGARRIGHICFELAQQQDIACVTVPDEAIVDAQTRLWQAHRLLVEPAGACALAALTSGAYQPARGEKIAVLVCGGNIAPDPLG